MYKNLRVGVETISGFEETERKEKTKFEIDVDGEAYRANVKEKLTFTNIIKVDPLIPELMSRREDVTRADLRGGAGISRMVDFRDAKNASKDSVRANIRDGVSIERMVDFRSTKILDGIDVNPFGPKSIAPNASLINIK